MKRVHSVKLFSYITKEKSLLIKPLTFTNENTIFSMNPVKAKHGVYHWFQIKNEYITVEKNGFLIIEIIPISKKVKSLLDISTTP